MYTVSIDSGTPEQIFAIRVEMEFMIGIDTESDPLYILIAIEECDPDHCLSGQALLIDIETGESKCQVSTKIVKCRKFRAAATSQRSKPIMT